jgi:hypothetical protein
MSSQASSPEVHLQKNELPEVCRFFEPLTFHRNLIHYVADAYRLEVIMRPKSLRYHDIPAERARYLFFGKVTGKGGSYFSKENRELGSRRISIYSP